MRYVTAAPRLVVITKDIAKADRACAQAIAKGANPILAASPGDVHNLPVGAWTCFALDLDGLDAPAASYAAAVEAAFPGAPVALVSRAKCYGREDTELGFRRAFHALVDEGHEAFAKAAAAGLPHSPIGRAFARTDATLQAAGVAIPWVFGHLLTGDRPFAERLAAFSRDASRQRTILVRGETGTGKELLAAAAHRISGRSGAYVVMNSAGHDDQFFTDALFGHLKGSFTGADSALRGLAEAANGGTLFLDEIGDLSPASQAKLLRFLEHGEYLPIGADRPRRMEALVVAATNRDLESEIAAGSFRSDLYFRLAEFELRVPPLRERPEDIPLLFDYYCALERLASGQAPCLLEPEAAGALAAYPFPGNVRELRSVARRAAWKADSSGRIAGSDLEDCFVAGRGISTDPIGEALRRVRDLPNAEEVKDLLALEALRRADGQTSVAARLLGITPQALNKRLRSLRRGLEEGS